MTTHDKVSIYKTIGGWALIVLYTLFVAGVAHTGYQRITAAPKCECPKDAK